MEIILSYKTLERDPKILLVLHGLFNFSTMLSSLFVTIYLWKIQKDFNIIAVYYLTLFVFSTLSFVLSGWLLAKWGRTRIYQMGILFHAVFFIIILILKERASDYVVTLGVIQGIALGFYWLAFNVLAFDLTNPNNRGLFYGLNGLVMSGAGLIGPLISGFVLSQSSALSGYRIIFSISLMLYFLTAGLSFLLGTYRGSNKYQLAKVMSSMNWNQAWKQFLKGNFMFGIREGIFLFIINLLVYISTDSEMSLGWFTALNSILSIGAFYLVGRMMSVKRRGKILLTGVCTILGATLVLAFEVNFYSLLLFGIINALFTPCLVVPYSTIGFDAINQDPKTAELRTEYIVLRELILNLGRVIPVILFIALFDHQHPLYLKLFLVIPSLALIGVWWYLRTIDTTSWTEAVPRVSDV